MKTNLIHKSFFIICALMFASFSLARALEMSSTYIGPVGGNWSDPNNWSPSIAPNNSGSQTFDVTVGSDYPGVTLDLNVAVNSLTMVNDFSGITLVDHSLSSTASSIGVNFPNEQLGGGVIYAFAQHGSVVANLGNLADFSGTTLNTGSYVADASAADLGVTATIQFNGANIQANNCYVGIDGAGSRFVDENGHDALANLQHTMVNGTLDIETGRSFTTGGPFVNEGEVWVISTGYGAPATLTVKGDYTGIGYPLDPGTVGLVLMLAPGPTSDAKMIIKGQLTNYDANTSTLEKCRFQWEAAGGRKAVTQALGGAAPLDIVTSHASLTLFGPHTGFRDRNGQDALRNLSRSARFLIGDRDFTTAGSFTSTSRLSIFGNSRFTVNGNLTIKGDQFQVFPLTGYAAGEDGFPNDPPYKKSYVTVMGNLNLAPSARFRFGIFDTATLPSVAVGGNAVLGGALVPYLLEGANVTSSDSFTLLSASKISGHFSNVASGGRVNVISFADESMLGTALVTITKTSLIMSDFQLN